MYDYRSESEADTARTPGESEHAQHQVHLHHELELLRNWDNTNAQTQRGEGTWSPKYTNMIMENNFEVNGYLNAKCKCACLCLNSALNNDTKQPRNEYGTIIVEFNRGANPDFLKTEHQAWTIKNSFDLVES